MSPHTNTVCLSHPLRVANSMDTNYTMRLLTSELDDRTAKRSHHSKLGFSGVSIAATAESSSSCLMNDDFDDDDGSASESERNKPIEYVLF